MAVALAVTFGAAPVQAHPFAYVTNEDGATVSQYNVGAGGLLAPLSPPMVAAGPGPTREVAVSPDGGSVYVTNGGNDSVSQYGVGPGGALSPKRPATVAAGANPIGVAVSPNGRSVYVANFIGGNLGGTVSQYDIGSGGELTPKSPATVFADSNPCGVAVSPDGHSVYVTNYRTESQGTVSQYNVGAGGALSRKSPGSVITGGAACSVAVSPDGKSVYVANNAGSVSQYDVGPGGALSPKSPPAVTDGMGPFGVAVSPDGRSVYVTNFPRGSVSPSTVSQFDVGVGGTLTPKSPATVAAGISPEGVAVSPDGHNVYVANNGSGKVSQYDVGAGGGLSPKSPAKVAAGDGPRGVAASPADCRTKGGGRFTTTTASSGRVVRKGDSLSSDRSRPVGPPNSGIAQRLHLEWGPPADPTKHSFQLKTKLTLAQCVDTPGVNPGQGQNFDTLIAEGRGTVDGSHHFKVRARLTDGGENPSGSGAGRDRVRVTITRVSDGSLVFLAGGRLGAGNQDARDGA
jgi:DNA-binding beta-propeller fold protein YncE